METNIIIQDIVKVQADAMVVNLFEGIQSPAGATGVVDKALNGIINDLVKQGELKGKLNEVNIIHTYGKIPKTTRCIKCEKEANKKIQTVPTGG